MQGPFQDALLSVFPPADLISSQLNQKSAGPAVRGGRALGPGENALEAAERVRVRKTLSERVRVRKTLGVFARGGVECEVGKGKSVGLGAL